MFMCTFYLGPDPICGTPTIGDVEDNAHFAPLIANVFRDQSSLCAAVFSTNAGNVGILTAYLINCLVLK